MMTELLTKTAKSQATRGDLFELQFSTTKDSLKTLTYGDLRLLFSRVVILGDPGGGKSTLCQHLCHDLARQAAASLQSEARKSPRNFRSFHYVLFFALMKRHAPRSHN
jgi:ABC-type transport system involved in cytochrome bd biosynthesis fused ATPase/permease subunit